MKIGAQLYTLKPHCRTLDDFAESLERVADMGYQNVQVSATCEYEAAWLKQQLDKNGLTCAITHISLEKLTGSLPQVIEDHRVFDCRRIGLGCVYYNEDDLSAQLERVRNTFRQIGRGLAEAGDIFMIHNHKTEFRKLNGKTVLEHLAEDLSPEEAAFTFDVYMAQAAGADPAAWLEKLSGRVPCVHLRDHAYDGTNCVLGEGNINFDRVLASAEKAGVEYLLVELAVPAGENAFDWLKRSYDFLRSRGLS